MYYIEPLPPRRTQTAEAASLTDAGIDDVTLRDVTLEQIAEHLLDGHQYWPDDASTYQHDERDAADSGGQDYEEGSEEGSEAGSQQEDDDVADDLVVIVTPELARDVQLVGAMQGVGFKDTQWLVQRGADFIQLTELLYRTLEQLDGERTFDQIAEAVTETTGRGVSGDNIQYLLEKKLIPLGLIKIPGEDGEDISSRFAPRSALQVRMRVTLMGRGLVEPFARVLQFLFWPPVMVAMLLLIVASQVWLFFVHGLGPAWDQTERRPELLLVLTLINIVSALFHELGHASGLRYGGGRARRIGAGLYIVYPVFFTDVTDSYRLGRWARVRTDMGGFYFSLISAVAVTALAISTHQEYLLLFVPFLDLEIVDEFSPFVRWDGYWLLADLTGIPDLYTLMGPFLRSLLPWHRDEKIPALKGWVKVVYAAFILAAIPFLAVLFFVLLVNLPSLISYTKDAIGLQTAPWNVAVSEGSVIAMALVLSRVFLLFLPVAGVLLILYSLGGIGIRPLWQWGSSSLRRRALTIVALVVFVAAVAVLWAPETNWRQLIASAQGLMGSLGTQSHQVTQTHTQSQNLPQQVHPAAPKQPAAIVPQAATAVASAKPSAAQTSETLPGITVTCASAVNDRSGQLCVHSQPGAALTIAVNYCGGYGATDPSESLRGTVIADRNGNYTWSWVPHATCPGSATATLTADWNHHIAYYTDTFNVR